MIGGIALTREMLDFCAEHGIASEVEVIRAARSPDPPRPSSGSGRRLQVSGVDDAIGVALLGEEPLPVTP